MNRSLTLTKHHGLGNDFLVVVDLEGRVHPEARAALARSVCARHRGVGADGLLFALPAPDDGAADVTMRLHNADGGVAEMSGNGIRCFVQAAVRAGLVRPGVVRVATDAGVRVVEAGATDGRGCAEVRVDMGRAVIDSISVPQLAAEQLGGGRYCTVDIGNPHLVVDLQLLSADPATGASLMAQLEALEKPFLSTSSKGINVEAVWPERPASDVTAEVAMTVAMRVWERGVGFTEACGTGACASAVAARAWGWCGDRVTIRQPGGDAVVELHDDHVVLVGPTQYIATIELEWAPDPVTAGVLDGGPTG